MSTKEKALYKAQSSDLRKKEIARLERKRQKEGEKKQRFDYAKSAVKRLAPAAIQQFAWSLILEISNQPNVFVDVLS